MCERLGIELWCGERDADAMESGNLGQKKHPLNTVIMKVWGGPPHPVARRLQEGDEVAGFRVLDVPGHSPGHVAYWRESDRVLICGDVLNGQNLITGIKGLHEPPVAFTTDPAPNREPLAAWPPPRAVARRVRPRTAVARHAQVRRLFVNGLPR